MNLDNNKFIIKKIKVLSIDPGIRNMGVFYGDIVTRFNCEKIEEEIYRIKKIKDETILEREISSLTKKLRLFHIELLDNIKLKNNGMCKYLKDNERIILINRFIDELKKKYNINPDLILIEKPAPKNKVIDRLSIILHCKLYDIQKNCFLISGKCKEKLKFHFDDTIKIRAKNSYNKRKAIARERVKILLKIQNYNLKLKGKLDDLSDAILQALAYIEIHLL